MKSSYGDFFKDKKITLMGLGLLGRGIGDEIRSMPLHCYKPKKEEVKDVDEK